VDRAWWNFFADYQPDRPAKATDGAAAAAPPTPAPAAKTQAAPAAPVPKQKPAEPAVKPAEKAPEKAEKKPAPAPQVPGGAEEVRLRGVAARTVTNMEASLAVPTATSVRAVPAKLLIDNRIVINNHLKRGRCRR
jgi:2-oxoglutarate dehydrogenase E1 component